LLRHFKIMRFLLISIITNLFFKVLLFLTYATRIFTIYLIRFPKYHLDLDILLNKIFELENIKLKYISNLGGKPKLKMR